MDLDSAYVASELARAQLLNDVKAIAEAMVHKNTPQTGETIDWASKALLALLPKYRDHKQPE